MTRCNNCWYRHDICVCWFPKLSDRCIPCGNKVDYCQCPDMVAARDQLRAAERDRWPFDRIMRALLRKRDEA